jgi:hypothetical protein
MHVSLESVTMATPVPQGFGSMSGTMFVELRCRVFMTPEEFAGYKGPQSIEIKLKNPDFIEMRAKRQEQVLQLPEDTGQIQP